MGVLNTASGLRVGTTAATRAYVGSTLVWPVPLQLAPALWLDAADPATITQSGGLVSQWDDKSGNGRHVTQGVAAAQPSTGTATLNGKNVLAFADDHLAAASVTPWRFMHDGTVWTLLAVAQFGEVADPNAVYGLLGTNAASGFSRGGWLGWDDRAASSRNDALVASISNGSAAVITSFTNNRVTPNAAHRILASFAPSASPASARFAATVDGGASFGGNTQTGTPSASAATYPLCIGSPGNGAYPLTGRIAEVIIVPRALTAAEITSVGIYLAAKWGLA